MDTEKSMIEIVKIDGFNVAIERQSNNCWVSLTDMAKRYGKRVSEWLRLPSTIAYLTVLSEVRKSHLAQVVDSKVGKSHLASEADLIITFHGGAQGEHGTWCTDYRIAMRFAQWLDPRFSVAVDDLLVRVINGERIISEDGFFSLGGKQWVSCSKYCSLLHRTPQSFYGLIGHYKKDFTWWEGEWFMSRDLFNMKDWQTRYENRRLDMRSKYDDRQLPIPYEQEIQEG